MPCLESCLERGTTRFFQHRCMYAHCFPPLTLFPSHDYLSAGVQAYIADKMAPYNRAGAFSLLMGVMSLALLLGPAVGSAMPNAQW